MKLRSTAFCLVLALSQVAMATDYYASPTGTDANGTSIEAPGSLTSMISKLKAGDTLYLLDGQYDLKSTLTINKKGDADNMITIKPYEDAKPVLDFRQQANKQNGVKVGGSYLHILGITIRYAGYKGIWVEGGRYNVLERLDVYGCCNAGIQLRSGGYNVVANCDSHDNFDYQDKGGNADGFADKQGDKCPGNVYIGCRSWNNSDDGWDSFERVTDGAPTVYVNCIAYNNGPATYDLTSHPRVTGVDAKLSCFTGKDLSNFPNSGNPNGFKVGGNGTKHNAEMYRCLAVGHRSKGFDQNNNAGNMKIVNCTAYGNKTNYGFGNSYPYTLDIFNCISLAPTGGNGSNYHFASYSGATISQGNNTWNKGFSVSADDFESLDVEGLILADRNPDGSLAETLLLHLKNTASGLIDKGIEYNGFEAIDLSQYNYAGEAPDLGCYEFIGSSEGISDLEMDAKIHPNMPRFDLQGHRVDENYRGIVIQAGRKFLQR